MVFGKSQRDREVGRQIVDFSRLIGRTVDEYKRMIDEYLDWDRHFKEQSKKVHKMESEADRLRREIERAMFEGAFLPAYRADYIGLLEALDKVANKAEEIGDNLFLMRPDIPEEIRSDFAEIARLTQLAYQPIPDAIERALDGETDFVELDAFVEGKEGEVDAIQFHVTRKVFKELEVDLAQSMLLKFTIDALCSVSDRIENVVDALTLVALARRL